MQKLVCNFVNEIAPFAQEVCVHLAQTFEQVIEGTDDVDGIGPLSSIFYYYGELGHFILYTMLII